MKMEQASGRQPPNAKNVIPITESGMKNVWPENIKTNNIYT